MISLDELKGLVTEARLELYHKGILKILDNLKKDAADVYMDKETAETDYLKKAELDDSPSAFTKATNRENIASGDSLRVIMGKIEKWFADLKTAAFTGSYNDLDDQPSIPESVAVKGNAESSYRTGNVNLTPENIGALAADGNATSATKATQDSAGQQINTTYIKGLSVSGKTITYTKGNGTTGTITTQDTTYSTATTSAAGLMPAADKTMMTKLTAGVNKTISSLSLSSVTFTGSSATPYCYMHAGTAISNLVYGHAYTVIVVVNSITGTSGGGIGVAVSPSTVTKGATAAPGATPLSITGVIGGTDKGTYIGTYSVPQGTTTMYAIPVASYGAGSATVNGNVSVILMY